MIPGSAKHLILYMIDGNLNSTYIEVQQVKGLKIYAFILLQK